MIEVKTPKNILVYKTKVLGPLNTKQLICFTIVIMLDLILYSSVIKPAHLPQEAVFYLFVFLNLPILAFGYYEPMGLPLEKYIKYYLQSTFLSPKTRKNKKVFYKVPKVPTVKRKKKETLYKAYQ